MSRYLIRRVEETSADRLTDVDGNLGLWGKDHLERVAVAGQADGKYFRDARNSPRLRL